MLLGSEEAMKRRVFLIATAMLLTPVRRASAHESAKLKRLAIVDPSAAPADIGIGGIGYAGIVSNLARPGGNVTGVNADEGRRSRRQVH
jgi:hypothetical protein